MSVNLEIIALEKFKRAIKQLPGLMRFDRLPW